MKALTAFLSGILFLSIVSVSPSQAQDVPALLDGGAVNPDSRSIRRDIPLTNAIQRALEAGTRNFTGKPGENYWQLETDYTIDVSLNPGTQTLSGSETIVVHNNSGDELDRIVLRLDHNIFRGLVPRGFSVPAENTEGMVVTRLVVDEMEVDLRDRPARRSLGPNAPSPELGVTGLDQTSATITLAEPIQPHSSVTLEIDWFTQLPGGPNGRGHRMTQRWEDELFQPTQWYPRVAKYDDLRGWDTSVYLGPAEFYNNFGRFDVRIDVPAGWIVSGTGVLQNPEEVLSERTRERLSHVLESDDLLTIVGADEGGAGQATAEGDGLVWHFMAEYVNDFAWATADNFIWQATRATIPERGPVPIHMVFLPERAHLFEGAAEITRHALEFYSDLWIPYPFPQLTLQDGPSAGMEYPMVINSNRGAADHETAHQWWPMMVGTNETLYGWMDEGFNQYMNILSGADRRGEEPNMDGLGQRYGSISGIEEEPSMMWASNFGGPMYGFQTYSKTPLMMSMLGGIVGDEEVKRAHRAYAEAWRFKHPSPWDYAFFMSNELGQDLGWFWYYWLWTTDAVDGSIEDVSSSGQSHVVTVRQDGQMPSPVVLGITFSEPGSTAGPMSNVEMTSDTTAVATWPVDVWFDGSKTFEATLNFGGRAIESITLDPHGRFPDGDPSDNVWPRTSEE